MIFDTGRFEWNNLRFKRAILIRNVAQGAAIKNRKGIKSFKFQFLMIFHVMDRFQRSPRDGNGHIPDICLRGSIFAKRFSKA